MRYLLLALVVAVLPGFQCNKDDEGLCMTNLSIIETQAPATGIVGSNLRIPLRCSGSDLCYSFSHLDLQAIAPRIYEIRTKGWYPCQPAICAQAIYYADTAVNIIPPAAGQYIFRFYNDQLLFKADTVIVN